MSNKQNNRNMTAEQVVNARREGQYVRAKTWSAKGERNNPRKNRRKAKQEIRKHY